METTEKHEEKVSEILARAAKLLNDAPKVYETNFELMKEQDALQQDHCNDCVLIQALNLGL